VIVVDTSAWVEFFRHTGSAIDLRLEDLLRDGKDVAVTEVVVMELLAGARSSEHAEELREHLLAFPVLRLRGLAGFEAAAALFRACRFGGETVREITDCLIAAVVIAEEASLLHADRDFEVLARHSPLKLEPV
jgi:predicted nucleic acid-binding protein